MRMSRRTVQLSRLPHIQCKEEHELRCDTNRTLWVWCSGCVPPRALSCICFLSAGYVLLVFVHRLLKLVVLICAGFTYGNISARAQACKEGRWARALHFQGLVLKERCNWIRGSWLDGLNVVLATDFWDWFISPHVPHQVTYCIGVLLFGTFCFLLGSREYTACRNMEYTSDGCSCSAQHSTSIHEASNGTSCLEGKLKLREIMKNKWGYTESATRWIL